MRLAETKIQFVKFVLVGLLNLGFGIVAFYFFLHILHMQYLLAFTITWLLGVLLTYTVNFVWIFKPNEKLNFRARLLKYLLVYLVSYAINVWLLKVGTEFFMQDPFYVQFGIIPVVVLINFFGMKLWSLK